MKYITVNQIKALNPCADQFCRFKRFMGKRQRIAVSVKAAIAVADQFDFDWLANRLLTAAARKAYNEAIAAARKAYSEAKAPAWKAYSEAIAPARKAYDEAKAAARKAYDEAKAPAWKAYSEAIAPARKAY